MMISFYRKKRKKKKNRFLFLLSPKPNAWKKGPSAGNRWSGWCHVLGYHSSASQTTFSPGPARTTGTGRDHTGAEAMASSLGHTSGMPAALTLFSCGCSGSSPEDVLLPHGRHNYVFHFSPLTYTCNENTEVGGEAKAFPLWPPSLQHWGHFWSILLEETLVGKQGKGFRRS